MTVSKPVAAMVLALSIMASTGGNARAEEAIKLELNKVEPAGKGCRIFMVFNNATQNVIETFKPDLVFFDKDGVIADRLVVEGGPLAAGKTRVKLFDVAGLACEQIQRVLLNDIRACGGQVPAACLDMTQTSTRGSVEFIK